MPAGIQYDPFADVQTSQRLTEKGVKAQGELLRPELMRQVGDALGGLNSIGALRSGAANVQLNEIGQNYADRVGQYASAATLGAMNTGLGAGGLRLDERRQKFTEDEARRQRKAGLMGAIGNVVGAGIGFAADRFFPGAGAALRGGE